MNCILNVSNLLLLLILTPTLSITAVKPIINCNYLTLNNIFSFQMNQSTHNVILSENMINFHSNSISNFWTDQGKSDLPKRQSTCSHSDWKTRLISKCPISSIDSINSSNCLHENCKRSSRFHPFHHSNQINAKLDYSVVSSLIGQIMLLPLIDFGYKTSLIYNASELKSSLIHSLLVKVELKQFLQTFLKLEEINEKVDNQSQLIINLINETFKIGQFKALLLSSNTKWSTQYISSSSIVTTKISLNQVKLNTQNLIRKLFTVLIVTNETCKLIFCSNSNSNYNQPFVDSITSTAIVLIMLLTLALIKFTLKRIDLPKKRFKNLIKRNDIFLDETQIAFIDVNQSNNIGNFKGEKVYLKRLPDKLLPLKKSTWKLFGQMIDLRNYNLVDFKGLFDNHHIVHHDQAFSTLYPQIGCFTVWEYCARGSLQNIIKSKCIDFDWSFKLSLLFDLSNGLKYLHSTIGKHGWLTSADCVVDNNWLLKITNFGLMTLYQTISNENNETVDCFQPTSSHLLWSSPEVIKCFVNNNNDHDDDDDWKKKHDNNNNNNNNTFTCNKHESLKKVKLNPCRWGSKESDVFSLSIIMSELINQSPPYNSQDTVTIDSIIRSIGSGIFVRPTVDSTDIPDDIIDLMEQCWSDNPDKRPSIDDIYDKFSSHSEGKTIIDSMVHKLEKYTSNLEAIVASRTLKLEEEMKKTESLLYRMLPMPVADALKFGQTIEPDKFEEVTVYFSDIVGFTTISAYSKPIEIISLLNDLYTSFDRIIDSYQVYKVETIGDAYMVVSGVPERRSDHAEQIADMALDILHSCTQIKIAHLPGVPLKIRIGINTGPVVAGVVGTTMPRYCLFGNTVNIASRMESTGRAYRIQISKRTMRHLRSTGIYHMEYRGEVDLKGRGKKSTYWLTGKDGFNKCLPEPEDDDGANHGFKDCEIIEIFGPNNKTSSDVSPSSPTGSMSPMNVFELNSLTKQNHSARNVLQVPK